MNKLRGTGVALVTPFTVNGAIDTHALGELVEYNISSGVDYLVVLGTTAESVTLSASEKQLVIDTVLLANEGRLPLVLGFGGNNTASLVDELSRNKFEGFDAILSVTPYYNRPSQNGLVAHYKALAEVSPLPILLYNVPSRTGCDLSIESILTLAKSCPNIIGIKEATNDLHKVAELIELKPAEFLVFSGDDSTALDTVLLGGDGVISVIGQSLPREFSSMINAGLKRENSTANSINEQLANLVTLIFKEGNPTGVKALNEILGYGLSEVRLPLMSASDELKDSLATALKKLRVTSL